MLKETRYFNKTCRSYKQHLHTTCDITDFEIKYFVVNTYKFFLEKNSFFQNNLLFPQLCCMTTFIGVSLY